MIARFGQPTSVAVRCGHRVAAIFELLQCVLQFAKTTLCQFWHIMKLCQKNRTTRER